jgi:hypothetical protein
LQIQRDVFHVAERGGTSDAETSMSIEEMLV